MENGLDKAMFFSNIKVAAKQKGVKIGELESAAGVSLGYISRTSKDSSSTPGFDFGVRVSKMLGVSLDSLAFRDLSKMTTTECRRISFIEKMIRDTQDDKLDWIRETPDDLNLRVTSDKEGNCSHPLFTAFTYTNKDGSEEIRPIFVSHSYETDTQIFDECFHFYMRNGTALYIVNVVHDRPIYVDEDCVREIWMCPNGEEKHFVCFSKDKNEAIAELVDTLYDEVSKSSMHPKSSKFVEDTIDSYLDDSGMKEPETEFDVLDFMDQ